MPYSLVLNLVPLSPIPVQYLQGRHLHALFLNLVSFVDRELGDRLHDQKVDKAFTLSPLQITRQPKAHRSRDLYLQWEHQETIPAGTPCWWRISLLDDALFGHLTKLWLTLNPKQPWHLGPGELQITSIQGTPQADRPWANFSSYEQIYQQASASDRLISLAFCTPVTFRQGKYDSALPTRECVFNSLLSRWHKYSQIELLPDLFEAVFPSFFDLRTQIVTDKRSKLIGCIGSISYQVLGNIEPIRIKQINALADFALYCGNGRKTTMGMGMVRRLAAKVAASADG